MMRNSDLIYDQSGMFKSMPNVLPCSSKKIKKMQIAVKKHIVLYWSAFSNGIISSMKSFMPNLISTQIVQIFPKSKMTIL